MSFELVREIVKNNMIGYLASVVDGQPKVRPMSCVMLEDGRLWSSTYRVSGKVAEFEKSEKVEICFVDSKFVQVRISGKIDVSGGEEKKKKLLELNPKVGNHFSDEKDPKFVHIEIVPTYIRYKPTGFSEYNVVEV